MTRRLVYAAYGAYGIGSVVFLGVALSRDSLWVAVGSALFLLGTLLLLLLQTEQLRR